jgi:dolichol kinase
MAKIDFSWDEDSNQDINTEETKELPSRKNLQFARRLFHMANGVTIATLYWLSFTHAQAIHTLGTFACLLYLMEQIRINYPEQAQKLMPLMKFIMRAEEQLKESAMVPYAFAVLLTIITFPKPLALIAIYTLAISDPLSAIIGIQYGKRRVVPHKSIEGSLAFFFSSLIITLFVLSLTIGGLSPSVVIVSLVMSLGVSIFEMLPIKLDDNLTIPLFSAFFGWVVCLLFGIHL